MTEADCEEQRVAARLELMVYRVILPPKKHFIK